MKVVGSCTLHLSIMYLLAYGCQYFGQGRIFAAMINEQWSDVCCTWLIMPDNVIVNSRAILTTFSTVPAPVVTVILSFFFI